MNSTSNSPWYAQCPSQRLISVNAADFLRSALLVLIALIGHSFSVFGQTATLLGTVTDPSGAALPSVSITVASAESNAVRKIQTNSTGQYVAADLNIGHYIVKAELPGFKASERKDIVLQVGDRDRVDFQMQVGQIQETVTVEGNAVHVQTDSGEQSNVITGQQISQLAVSGRSIINWRRWCPAPQARLALLGV